jgi:hypothetical protein
MDKALAAAAQVTVVTAYYPVKSKHKVDKYLEWIRQFWPAVPCNLVFFTDPHLVKPVESLLEGRKGQTIVAGVPFQELNAFHAMSPAIWQLTGLKDPEREIHTPELYALWYEKKEFVRRAIQMNPFGSEFFVWCDAGICRYKEYIPYLNNFPVVERLPRGKMLVLQVSPFQDEDKAPKGDGICGDFLRRNAVGGGILASDQAGWTAWSAAYDAMFMRYWVAGRFVGKDQSIIASVALEQPDLFQLVSPPDGVPGLLKWFYLLFYLSKVEFAGAPSPSTNLV